VAGRSFALSTTSTTALTFCTLTCATSNSSSGAQVEFVIEVKDGSSHVSTITGVAHYSASNRGGTVLAATTTATAATNYVVSDSTTFTGLAATWSATVTGTTVNLKMATSWAAGTPTAVTIKYKAIASGTTAPTLSRLSKERTMEVDMNTPSGDTVNFSDLAQGKPFWTDQVYVKCKSPDDVKAVKLSDGSLVTPSASLACIPLDAKVVLGQ
jgi:hypothetical protein